MGAERRTPHQTVVPETWCPDSAEESLIFLSFHPSLPKCKEAAIIFLWFCSSAGLKPSELQSGRGTVMSWSFSWTRSVPPFRQTGWTCTETIPDRINRPWNQWQTVARFQRFAASSAGPSWSHRVLSREAAEGQCGPVRRATVQILPVLTSKLGPDLTWRHETNVLLAPWRWGRGWGERRLAADG